MKQLGLFALGVVLSACALKGDVRRVEQDVEQLREQTARADSAQTVLLDQLLSFHQRFLDSIVVLQRRLAAFQGDVRTDMTEVQRQLVQLQELSGQSQQRLSELRAQLDQRQQGPMIATPVRPGDTAAGAGPSQQDIDVQQIYELSLQNLRRGATQTARSGFRRILSDYPQHVRAADALFFIGESWEETSVDSAAAAYEKIVQDFRDSRHAPTALYRLGLIAERRGNQRAAELYYQRVIAGYPRSDEAQLARTKLNNPGPY